MIPDAKILSVTSKLKTYEKVSLIFLLCKKPIIGFTLLESISKSSTKEEQDDLFSCWIHKEEIFKDDSWSNRFLEAITIIQNYKIGKLLGYNKEELEARYLPHQILKTVSLSSLRKALYNLCDNLTKSETQNLIQSIQKEFKVHLHSESDKYLEFKLLFWDFQNVLSLGDEKINMEPLLKYLKHFGFSSFVTNIVFAVSYMSKPLTRSEEFYNIIDETDIGFCVIINEEHFHKSEVVEFQSLLPDHDFNSRMGTDKDVERLQCVFTAFGFDVKVYTDVEYKELMHILEYYSKLINKNHSFFTLVFLSHGSENVVYTSDSIPVNLDEIELTFQGQNSPNLIGKPKIFIIQSCQGQEWQQIQVDTAKFSGPQNTDIPVRKIVGPEKGDSMIAWSTVKGYASFRDKKTGSWFIQEFCNALWEFGNTRDLVDIFTYVNSKLRGKTYEGQFMVPWLSLSLCKKVKFVMKRELLAVAENLGCEGVMFEKYFRHTLVKSEDKVADPHDS